MFTSILPPILFAHRANAATSEAPETPVVANIIRTITPMSIATYIHDPDAVVDYSVDWSDWLPTGDTIDTSEWTIASGLTKVASSVTGNVASIVVSGGTAGQELRITDRMTTVNGRVYDRTIVLLVRNQ